MLRRCLVLVGWAALGLTARSFALDYATENAMKRFWTEAPRPTLMIPHLNQTAKLDGVLDEPVWQQATAVSAFINRRSSTWHEQGGGQHSIVTGYSLAAAQTQARLYRTDDALYVAYRCEEPEIEALAIKRGQGRDGGLWNNDCIEFLCLPSAGDPFHFIVDAKNDIYDSRAGKRNWNLPQAAESISVKVHKDAKDLSKSYWVVEMRLPFAALGATPKPAAVWQGNLCRERYAAGYKDYHEINTWTGTIGAFPDPTFFGCYAFGDIAWQFPVLTQAPIGGMNVHNTNQENENPFLGRNTASVTLVNHGRQAARLEAQVLAVSTAGTEPLAAKSYTLKPGQTQRITLDYLLDIEGAGYAVLLVKQGDRTIGAERLGFRSPEIGKALEQGLANARELKQRANPDSAFASTIGPYIAQLEAKQKLYKQTKQDLLSKAASPAGRKVWNDLEQDIRQAMSAGNYILWSCSPSLPVGLNTYPDAMKSVKEIPVNACINEYENAVVNITNFTADHMDFYVMGNIPLAAQNPRSGFPRPIRPILQNHAKAMRGFGDPKVTHAEDTGISMPLLDLGEHPVVHIPPYSTRQIWFTTHTRGAAPTIRVGKKPGRPYAGQVTFIPISHDQLAPQAVRFRVHVYDFEIPEVAALGTFAWNYTLPLAFMRRYKFNTFFGAAFSNPQKQKDGTWKFTFQPRRYAPVLATGEDQFRFILGYGFIGSYIQWAKKQKIEYMSPQWQQLLKQFFKELVAGLKGLGLSYDRFVIQSIDECHGAAVKQLAETVPLLRAVDSNVKWMMTVMASRKELEAMAPYTDVWMNRNGKHWQMEFYEAEQAKGKPLYSWHMAGDLHSNVLSWTRTYGWRAWKHGFDNISYFVFSSSVYNYQKDEPVAGRMIEGWRDTVEDWQYFHALEQEIAKAKARGVTEEQLKQAVAVMPAVLKSVLEHEHKKSNPYFPSDTQGTANRIEEARVRLAETILAVKQMEK